MRQITNKYVLHKIEKEKNITYVFTTMEIGILGVFLSW